MQESWWNCAEQKEINQTASHGNGQEWKCAGRKFSYGHIQNIEKFLEVCLLKQKTLSLSFSRPPNTSYCCGFLLLFVYWLCEVWWSAHKLIHTHDLQPVLILLNPSNLVTSTHRPCHTTHTCSYVPLHEYVWAVQSIHAKQMHGVRNKRMNNKKNSHPAR